MAGINPLLMRFLVVSGSDELFHLHLFKFARPKNEVAGRDLIAKRLANLSDAKGKLAPAGSQHIQKIDEYPLGRFRTKINKRRRIVFGGRADMRLKHQVERAR